MKTKLFILLILSACVISCVNSNKPLTDSEKEKVQAEVRDFVNTFYKANVELNADILSGLYDSTSYLEIKSGKIQSYKEVFGKPEQVFDDVKNLKVDILDSRISVIDASTALYREVSRFEETFNDSSIIMGKPWNLSLVLKKINNQWKIVGDFSYGHTEFTRSSTRDRELNQLELYRKYYSGTWQSATHDTISTSTYKPLGKYGIERSIQTVCNGKVLSESKTIIGYNSIFDAMLGEQVNLITGNAVVMVQRFITPTKVEVYPMNNINEPQFSRVRYEVDLSSPDTRVQKMFVEGKLVRTTTSKKIS